MAIASQGDLPSWSNYPCPTRYHFFATSDGIAARGNLWRCCENFSAEILSKPYPLNPHTPRHYSPIILGVGEKSRQQKTWRKGETCGDLILLRMEYYGYSRVVFYFFWSLRRYSARSDSVLISVMLLLSTCRSYLDDPLVMANSICEQKQSFLKTC